MIKQIFIRIRNNELVKTSFLTGIGTVIQQISVLVVLKIIAVTLGKSGIALISQYIDFIAMSSSTATGGIQQGVVKYVAEFQNDRNRLARILSTSLRITLISTLIVSMIIFIFSGKISDYLFQTREYQFVLCIFGFTIILFGLNVLLLKILNGTNEIKKLVLANISNSMFGLLVITSFAYFFGLKGALIALSISQSVVFFISLMFVIKSDWFAYELFSNPIDKKNTIRLLKYTLMGISSMVLTPLVIIGIRDYIITNISINDAGIWSGLWKLSNAYLSIITLTLSYYYLPKLSQLTKPIEIRKELISGFKIIIPVLAWLILAIYIFRKPIIIIIFNNEFLSMESLFIPQLIGDFFKIFSWLISYLMLAKAKTVMFISTQLIFTGVIYYLSIFLLNNLGLEGVVYAYAITNVIYTFTVAILLRKYFYAKE